LLNIKKLIEEHGLDSEKRGFGALKKDKMKCKEMPP